MPRHCGLNTCARHRAGAEASAAQGFRRYPRKALLVIAAGGGRHRAGAVLVRLSFRLWLSCAPARRQDRSGRPPRSGWRCSRSCCRCRDASVTTRTPAAADLLRARIGRDGGAYRNRLPSHVARPRAGRHIAGVLLAAYAGSLAAVMAQQLPPRCVRRASGLPYGVAVAVFGGLSPAGGDRLAQAPAVSISSWPGWSCCAWPRLSSGGAETKDLPL